MLHGIWDIISQTRDQPCPSAVEEWSLNHWTHQGSPTFSKSTLRILSDYLLVDLMFTELYQVQGLGNTAAIFAEA